jgi:putative peptidoglycan lipid II flippase
MSQGNLRTIAKAASLVVIFFIISRVLGVVRDAVLAGQFGTSREYEAYLAAFSIPDFIFYVISGGALGSAFIPTFASYLTKGDTQSAWRLASAVLNWLLLVQILLASLMAIFAPALVDQIFFGFSPEAKRLTANLMRWLLISTVIFGMSGLAMGILQAHQHFLLPAVAPVVYNLAIIAGALFLAPSMGVYGLVVGVVIGAAGHFLVQVPGLLRFYMRYDPILMPSDPGVRQVARLMGPRMFGLAAVQFNFVWDKILASGLTIGSLSGLDYGRRIMLLPQGIIGQAVASAAFPTFAALVAEENWGELQHAFTSTLRSILYLSIPSTIGLLILGRPLIQVIFERYEFDAESTQFTYWALAFYSLGLISHSVLEIVTRAFYALHNTKTPVVVGVITMGVNIILSWILMAWFDRVGLASHGGIALASSIAVTLETIWLVNRLRRLPGEQRSGLQSDADVQRRRRRYSTCNAAGTAGP